MAKSGRAGRIALAQVNPTVGDLAGNRAIMERALAEARQAGADLVVFPELALTGCPPEDLVLRRDFLAAVDEHLHALAWASRDMTVIVGAPWEAAGGVVNGAVVLADGRVAAVAGKKALQRQSVLDEHRSFGPGSGPKTVAAGPWSVAVAVGDDGEEAVPAGPGVPLVVQIAAAPFQRGEGRRREGHFAARARQLGAYMACCALVGGQDELLFAGGSFVADPQGCTIARAPQFQEHLLVAEVPVASWPPPPVAPFPDPLEEVYEALVLAIRDYARKNGFQKAVLGVSGGLDSALAAALAADALGPENVVGVGMPARYSSEHGKEDARALVANLGITYHEIDINGLFQGFLDVLAPFFQDLPPNAAEENLQARIRGTLVMALSNKFGWLALTATNKSEFSIGYSTMYGDAAGGFAALRDVPKTLAYELARWRNARAGKDLIPQRILEKPPSAELRPGQKDIDTLPDYPVLDGILEAYVERGRTVAEIVAEGYDPETVRRIVRMVEASEYKRRQGPPGAKISRRAFGKDRRMPITNKYRPE